MKKASNGRSKRQYIWGYVVILTISFLYFKYWYSPKAQAIMATESKITQLQKKIDSNRAVVNDLQARAAASVVTKVEESPMLVYLQSNQRLAQIVQQLIADDPSLVTRLIAVEKSEKESSHKDISFKIEIVGSFPQIGAFVERLEDSRILAEVASLDISRLGTDLEKCVAKIGLHARVFTEGDHD